MSSNTSATDSLPPLWNLLVCPACGDSLKLEVYDGTTAAPEEGLLRSACGLWFPVVRGIPRIFVGEMRASIYPVDFPDFLAKHNLSVTGADQGADTRLKLATRESFGYEWTHFHEMLPEWEQNANFYFEPIGGPQGLRGQLGHSQSPQTVFRPQEARSPARSGDQSSSLARRAGAGQP